MAILLTGAGGLFTRLGLLFGTMRDAWGFLGNTPPVPASLWGASGPTIGCVGTCAADIDAQYVTSLQGVVSTLFSGSLVTVRNSLNAWVGDMVAISNNTLIQMANNDTPLSVLDVPHAMKLLIDQMVANSNTVTRNVPGITTTPGGGNVGNPNSVASFVGSDGRNLQYLYPETMVATVTNDQNGSATPGNEPVSIVAPAADTKGLLDWQWPLGSGATKGISIIDPTLSNQGAGNLLNNSSWNAWTGQVPNGWHVLVGATQIQKDVSNLYGKATGALEFLGDGTTLTSLYQQFGTDTTTTLLPNTVYNGCAIIKLSGATTGTLAIDLTDTSSNVVNDAAGTPNASSTVLTNQIAFTAVPFTFRTPAVTPSGGYRLRIHLTAAIPATFNLFINYLGLTPATQLYQQGPYFNMFRGSNDVAMNDYVYLAITNTLAGAFETMFFRTFPMSTIAASYGQKYASLPFAASGTINDNLVTV